MTATSPDSLRAAWLEERLTGIGGSEASSVFNLGYGCQRRLAYEKRRIEPDYPRDTTLVMSLGNLMEPWFADQYVRKTGRTVSSPSAFCHPEHPELRVNVDRLIDEGKGKKGKGVLEIKSQGLAAFSKTRREGLIEDYILQLQWALVVTCCEWGSFAIGCRDSGELTHWDVDRDDSICREILQFGPELWSRIKGDGPLPDRLEVDDRRCADCNWRNQCQGDAFIHLEDGSDIPYAEEIRPLLVRYDEQKPLFDEAEALLDETKELIRCTLSDRSAVAVSWPDGHDRKVYFRPHTGRISWRTEELLKKYDALRTTSRETICESPEAELEFDLVYPPVNDFKREGVPFRTLRIY